MLVLLLGLATVGADHAFVFKDFDLKGGDSGSVYGLNLEGDAQVHGIGCCLEDTKGDTGSEEGSEEHIAGNSGETVKIGNTHRVHCFTCQAAPSMRAQRGVKYGEVWIRDGEMWCFDRPQRRLRA